MAFIMVMQKAIKNRAVPNWKQALLTGYYSCKLIVMKKIAT